MRKISELVEKRFRTKESRDSSGRLVRDQVEFIGPARIEFASSGMRYLHYFVDGIIVNLFFGIASVYTDSGINAESEDVPLLTQLIGYLIYALCYVGYFLFFEGLFQKSPAKFLSGCLVVNEFAQRPSFHQIMIRSLTRIVPFEAFSFFNDETRGWHDKWSNTYVLKKRQLEAIQLLQVDPLNRTDNAD